MSAGQSFAGQSNFEAFAAWKELPLGNKSADFSIDWTLSNYQSFVTADAITTINIPATGVGYVQLKITQDAIGGHALPGFSPDIDWDGGNVPTLSQAPGAITFL